MRRLLLTLTLVATAAATAARADVDLRPGWADVVGVEEGDALAIRDAPSPDARQLGAIPTGTEAIELFSCQKPPQSPPPNWCVVEYGGVRGWVNARYLHIFGDI